MRYKLKTFIGFYQCIAAVPSVFKMVPPLGLEEFTRWINLVELPAELENVFVTSACLGDYRTRVWLGSAWPIAFIILFAVGFTVWESLLYCRKGNGVPRNPLDIVRGALQRVLPLTLGVTFLLVPGTSTRIFKSFLCETFEFGGGEVRRYLYADLTLRCESEEHEATRGTAFLMLAVWPVGIPLLYAWLLWLSRRAIHNRVPTPLSRATAFLWGDYEVSIFWWEPLEMCRKLTMTGWVLMVKEDAEHARVLVALLVSIVFLVLELVVNPLKRMDNRILMTLVHLSLVLVYTCVLLVKACDASAEACALFGFGTTSKGIYLFFIIFGLAFLCLILSVEVMIMFYTFTRSMRVRALRVMGTGRLPELTLLKGHKYHLFLSHVWSTGQDAVATIKRQLQLLLYGVQIFLDVDDLKSIDELELYIKESEVILLYLSKGYFGSRNCLREVEATLAQGKRYLFVHEADAAKGGGPLEELQKELKNDGHRKQLFDDAHRVIVWHRISAFQGVSLVQIAEDMLRQCEGFHESLSLYIPDSVLTQELVFKTRVVLYVSRHNQGAAEVSRELHLRFREIHTTSTRLQISTPRKRSRTGTLQPGVLAAIQGAAKKGPGFCGSIVPRQVGEMRRQASGSKLARWTVGASRVSRSGGAALRAPTQPTHFLLYLNEQTYVGDNGALARELREARTAGLPTVMIHEKDSARGGCEFGNFFETTPQDLIDGGLYSALATAFESGEAHRVVSHKLFAKNLGATAAPRRGVVSQHLRRTTRELSRSTSSERVTKMTKNISRLTEGARRLSRQISTETCHDDRSGRNARGQVHGKVTTVTTVSAC